MVTSDWAEMERIYENLRIDWDCHFSQGSKSKQGVGLSTDKNLLDFQIKATFTKAHTSAHKAATGLGDLY